MRPLNPRIAVSVLILVIASLGPRVADACGPYLSLAHDVEVRVLSPVAASAGFSVAATCGEKLFEGTPQEDGTFLLEGLRGTECFVVATAHECYQGDRSVRHRIHLPAEGLVVSIPDR